ncbi:MAG: M24 family metallopeptidase [Solirubrobacteraceae bacterium]
MSARAQALVQQLPGAGVDAILITSRVNVRYLTGYTGSNGIAVLTGDAAKFMTDFRYVEQAAEEVDRGFQRRTGSVDLLETVPDALPQGELRLGFEDAHLSVWQHGRLRELLPDRVELVAVHGLIEGLRSVKDPSERALLQDATELADAALQSLLGAGLVGRTERQVAIALEREMLDRGAERPSFDSIVAAGPHGALPHAKPREHEIRSGELVVIDWGAALGGYCSDCTRTIAAGEPGERGREVYELVLEAQLAGVEAVKAGAHGRDVDSRARSLINAGGYGEHFGHGLGHGVGLDVHEAPRLSQSSADELARGNAVTVEPGIYLPGEFGVRIEDLVIVTDDGCEILTSLGKQLIVVD